MPARTPDETRAAAAYGEALERIRASFADLPAGTFPRLAKRSTNLFRFRTESRTAPLSAQDFDRVIAVDPETRTAEVGGMTTYEDLVDVTLRYGLMPYVVPQLKTITLGGAVTGLGIESSSFKYGMPHESVEEMDILTGDGQVVTARGDNEHADLFRAFPNSYGTLGYALRLRIRLLPVAPFVALRHLRFTDASACMLALQKICEDSAHEGEPIDFVDGTYFGPGEQYLTLGRFTAHSPYTSDYTGRNIYYRSIQQREEDWLTVRDYLWRWDTDWFWCSGAFGVQVPFVRSLVPRRWLRSDVYRKLIGIDHKYGLSARLDRWRGKPARESVIQDVQIPVEAAAEFLGTFHRTVGMSPVWMCPVRTVKEWPLYPLPPDRTQVNFGFWGLVALPPDRADGYYNGIVEQTVQDLEGQKSLYSTSLYERDEFWRTYNGDFYWPVKRSYDPAGRLLDLYEKCVQYR